MAIDATTFRQTAGQFVTGVTVIAMEVGGSIRALTANSFTSLSLEPPLVLFCLGKQTKAGQMIEAVRGFSVNILSAEQQSLSSFFAGSWSASAAPPFAFTAWEGGPRLDGSVASLGCAVRAVHEGGDHWIVVGEVIAMHSSVEPRRPLVFHAGRYGSVAAAAPSDTETPLELEWPDPPR